MLHRLLGDVGEHRIGPAERHHGHFGEEHRDVAEHVVRAGVGREILVSAHVEQHRAAGCADQADKLFDRNGIWRRHDASLQRLQIGRDASAGASSGDRFPMMRKMPPRRAMSSG
nr:hypothetical protein [Methylobacterium currus]